MDVSVFTPKPGQYIYPKQKTKKQLDGVMNNNCE